MYRCQACVSPADSALIKEPQRPPEREVTFQVHQMVEQYMEKCAMPAAEQAMLDLKQANKAEPASPGAPPSSSRPAAQASGTSLPQDSLALKRLNEISALVHKACGCSLLRFSTVRDGSLDA